VQSLYPTLPSTLAEDDLVSLYAYPVERTWVRSNFVSTVDGAVQGADGRSGSIAPSGDATLFALLRSLCDVVLVGGGTARAEGYQPVREEEIDTALRRRLGLAPLPAIAVVTRSLRLEGSLTDRVGGAVLVVTTAAAVASRSDVPEHWEVVVAGEEVIDLRSAIDQLAARGHRRILCEGGPRLLRDLLASGCCDEVCLSISPEIVAGGGARMTHGEFIRPPVSLQLQHVLEQDGTLFCRYARMRG
jgi:riboflavin biosynthesis pyrimidine reductase